jgi:hypothetical protein
MAGSAAATARTPGHDRCSEPRAREGTLDPDDQRPDAVDILLVPLGEHGHWRRRFHARLLASAGAQRA